MNSDESMWSIIKAICKDCFNTETSTQAGRINLLFGILIFFTITGFLLKESFIDKIFKLLNNDYQSGFPWYAIFGLILLFIAYSIYCVNTLNRSNKEQDAIDKIKQNNKEA